MPIVLPPVSRRRFLTGSLAAGAALLLPRRSWADDAAPDPHRFALLSDTHIHADRAFAKADANPWDNLQRACAQILAAPKRPAAVLVNGDCAAHQGHAADYATLIDALAPLRKGGLPIHLAMGNHDDRANFWQALPADVARQQALADRHVCLIESPRANLLILDSLDVVAKTPGLLGERQLVWLAKTLDARADKPALVFVHHDPDQRPEKVTGLTDTKALLDVILPRKQVKAYVYGHTHSWRHADRDGLHWVNLPPTAWLFGQGKPRGWVELTLAEQGATFELHTLDAAHAQNGEKLELKWR
jgi:Icc protein